MKQNEPGYTVIVYRPRECDSSLSSSRHSLVLPDCSHRLL